VATVLLEAGADMEATTLNGKTPLQLAIDAGHTAVERVLRQFQQRRATPQTLPAAQETGTRPSTLEASVARLEAEAADSAAELEQERQLHAETAEVGANAAAEVDRLRDQLNALTTVLAAAGLSDE
jgi:ankyrin repeat protein